METRLKEVYIKIGRSFFEFDSKLHIQKIDNGYVFNRKYYENIDQLIPDLEESLKNYFDRK